MRNLLKRAILAIECENSLWVARKMPHFETSLKAQKRLGGKLGLAKAAVTPTVILKEEDRSFLRGWQDQNQVPIHLWHAFYDLAFGLSLDRIEELITTGLIEPTLQKFQAPNGATTEKSIYKIYHHYAYPLGETTGKVTLTAEAITDANGHILPFVRFEGGNLQLSSEALQVLSVA